ncbi:MAG: Dihydroorotase [Chlamydiae bacterium]|nr:Dihydroorotase [Chlamydiota bacterium]
MKCVKTIDHQGLIELPALIDPHVHFRTPGECHKEDWKSGAFAAVSSGVTMVCDMPNNKPPCMTIDALIAKKKIIDSQLRSVGIPLRYGLYLGADKNHLDQIEKAKEIAIGVKVYLGSTTGSLLVESALDLDEVFRRAASVDMVVVVHAEDEEILKREKERYGPTTDPAAHSKIRSPEAAIVATREAIKLAAKYQTSLYIAHLSTKEELELVRQAKKDGLPVYAEVTPHHLFLTVDDYAEWKSLVQANPPLRSHEDQEALWAGIADGTVDTIGSDHAPHLLEEKRRPYPQSPSGIPGIETLLPLMLDAVNQKRLSLERLTELTHTNAEKIFSLPPNDDRVWVDMEMKKEVRASDLKTKCGWSPYAGRVLTGWPVYTIVNGEIFAIQ